MTDKDENKGNPDEFEAQKRALRNIRKAKLGQLTRRRNIITELMKDDMNANEVEQNALKYNELFEEFKDMHKNCQRLLDEHETKEDELWFEPKHIGITQFMNDVKQWISVQTNPDKQERDAQDEIQPDDSVSVFKVTADDRSSKGSSVSQASSALGRQAIADRAALEIKIAALRDKTCY